jgi:hypothetical protein
MFAPMTIPVSFEVAFWSVAFIISGFLGWFCFEIHNLSQSSYKWPAFIQQVWLNFIGAIVGWTAVWLLVRQWWTIPPATARMTVSDLGLALTAFIGVTGYLPFTVIGAIITSVLS